MALPFFGTGMKNGPFPVLWPLLSFPNCWHTKCGIFTASSLRVWNSLTGIPSPPLVLFIVILPKVHLTSHSRISGSRWMITPSWLSGLWRSFLYSSSVYSCHLFLISSASVRSTPFLPYCAHVCMKRSLGISNFLEEISSLSHSIVSLYFLHSSLRKAFLCLLAILWNSALKWVYFSFSHLPFTSLLSQLFVKPPQTTILPFCISFSWGWSWSMPPVQCHEPPSIVLQALCLSDLIPWIYLSLPLYNCKGFDLGLPEWSSCFPYFLHFFNFPVTTST